MRARNLHTTTQKTSYKTSPETQGGESDSGPYWVELQRATVKYVGRQKCEEPPPLPQSSMASLPRFQETEIQLLCETFSVINVYLEINLNILLICIWVHVGTSVCVFMSGVEVRGKELGGVGSLSTLWGAGIRLRLPGLAASTFVHWPILLTPAFQVFKVLFA